MLGNEKDYIATRVAHKLNLTGPAISVHTACSTSLVAICQAVDSLRAGQCDMALAGGVVGHLPAAQRLPVPGGRDAVARRPHAHASMRDAQGTVFSDGAAVVLLKRLSDARRRRRPDLRGDPRRRDQQRRRPQGQLHRAQQRRPGGGDRDGARQCAGVDPRSISYVEAHGTATPLGDPIEIEGLTQAFRRSTERHRLLPRSVRSRAMSATWSSPPARAGVIKTALALARATHSGHRALRARQPDDRLRRLAVRGQRRAERLAARRRAAARRRQLVRRRRHQRARGARGSAARCRRPSPAQGPQLLVLSARTPAALGAGRRAPGRSSRRATATPTWPTWRGRSRSAARRSRIASRWSPTTSASAVAALRHAETAAAAARSRPARPARWCSCSRARARSTPAWAAACTTPSRRSARPFDECAEALARRTRLRPARARCSATTPKRCCRPRSCSRRRSPSSTRWRGSG